MQSPQLHEAGTVSTQRGPVFEALIFDLGDVLFKWSAGGHSAVTPKALRQVLESNSWADFQCGRVGRDECYTLASGPLGIEPSQLQEAFDTARESLRPNQDLVDLIRSLRDELPDLKVYAMSNISLPDYELLRKTPVDWSIFDRVFISALAHVRKPDLGFYKHVIQESGCDPTRTVFVDDKLENVISARSFGMKGIVFEDFLKVARCLKNTFLDPVRRAEEFLTQNAQHLVSFTHTGAVVFENFSQMLILEVTGKRELVDFIIYPRHSNFFQGKGQLTTADFPYDLDTTSLAFVNNVLGSDDTSLVNSVMDEMLEYRNSDGIIQVYFDHTRPRFDPVVSVNVLALFYMYGRGHELKATFDWVQTVLVNRAYLEGTRYYTSPEIFLYFVTRLLDLPFCPKGATDHWRLLAAERVRELIGSEGDALSVAMRVIICARCDIPNEVDYRRLLDMQSQDGGWEGGWIYKYGSSGIKIANRGLTTALAIDAILKYSALSSSIARS